MIFAFEVDTLDQVSFTMRDKILSGSNGNNLATCTHSHAWMAYVNVGMPHAAVVLIGLTSALRARGVVTQPRDSGHTGRGNIIIIIIHLNSSCN